MEIIGGEIKDTRETVECDNCQKLAFKTSLTQLPKGWTSRGFYLHGGGNVFVKFCSEVCCNKWTSNHVFR